ncbi:hypothetical protein THAOC_04854, partial [Thalassiosira oceanica]
MTSDVDSLERLRDELQDQLAIATAAKTSEESQGALIDYVQNEAEPLSADHPGALIVPFVRWGLRNTSLTKVSTEDRLALDESCHVWYSVA